MPGDSLRDNKVHSEIRKNLNPKPLLQIKRPQLRWFSHVSKMSPERLERQPLLAIRYYGKNPRGRPRTRWSDYVSNLARSHHGVELAELFEIAETRELFRVLMGPLVSDSLWRESGYE